MVKILKCSKCPIDEQMYDIPGFTEHYAANHIDNFYLYKCPSCKNQFVSAFLAHHHMMLCCDSSIMVQDYSRHLQDIPFENYKVLNKAIEIAVTEATNNQNISDCSSSSHQLESQISSANNNSMPLNSFNNKEHSTFQSHSALVTPTSPKNKSKTCLELHDDHLRRKRRNSSPPRRFESRRDPPKSLYRERSRSRDNNNTSFRHSERFEASSEKCRPPRPVIRIRSNVTNMLDAVPRVYSRSVRSLGRFKIVKRVSDNNLRPQLIHPNTVSISPLTISQNSRIGSKLTGPMNTRGMLLFDTQDSMADLKIEIEAPKGYTKMFFNQERLAAASKYFAKIFASPEFVASAEKKICLRRALGPFLDGMNYLHKSHVPWKPRCKSYFQIANMHRVFQVLKEAKDLEMRVVTNLVGKDLWHHRCALISNEISDCVGCIERIVLSLYFDIPIPDDIGFTENACCMWFTDCTSLSCAPELDMVAKTTEFLWRFMPADRSPAVKVEPH